LGYTLYKGELINDLNGDEWDEDDPHTYLIPVQDIVKIDKNTKVEVERISLEKWLSRSMKRPLQKKESEKNEKRVKVNAYLEHIFSTMSVWSSPKAHSYFKD
jgi:hypothetical protein